MCVCVCVCVCVRERERERERLGGGGVSSECTKLVTSVAFHYGISPSFLFPRCGTADVEINVPILPRIHI